jgi:uncharacterized protein YjdB
VQGGFTGIGNINIASDNATGPQFVNPTVENYQLQENSPCINAGNNSGLSFSDTDLAGNPRIYGEKVDIGAYELQNFSVIGISLSPKKTTLVIGDSAKVTTSVVPYYAVNQNIIITNIDTGGVAYITNNTIYATLSGITLFVFTTEEGDFSDTCTVTVNDVGIVGMYGIHPIQIYPNPTTGQLIINNEQLTIKNIEIFDVVGCKLWVVSGAELHDSQFTIDISHLANGMYFLKIDDKTFKIIKN